MCSTRYYVNPSGKCGAVNPLCKDYNPQNGACTNCYPGYGISGVTCVQGLAQDTNCKRVEGSACKECVNGFYVAPDGKCKQVSPLCKSFDKSNGNCLTCYNGYEVVNGACVIAKSQDPNCKKADGNFCQQCYQGYIPINGKCMVQNPLCRTIDMSNGGCMTCWQGYALAESNCVL